MPAEFSSLVEKLHDNGMLSDEKWLAAKAKVNEVKAAYEASKKAVADRNRLVSGLKKVGVGLLYAASVPVFGYPAYKVLKGTLGW